MIIKIKKEIVEKHGNIKAIKVRENLLDLLINDENVLSEMFLQLDRNITIDFNKTKGIIQDLFLEEISDGLINHIIEFYLKVMSLTELKEVYRQRCKKGVVASWISYIKYTR